MYRLLLAIALLFQLHSHCQVNQKKLDSLEKAIDRNQKRIQASLDSFNKLQDSLYKLSQQKQQVQEDINRMSGNATALAKKREAEEKSRTRIYLLVGLGILLLILIAISTKKASS
jgi:septal ring factor EnvC (AmiA/AmiB activator)